MRAQATGLLLESSQSDDGTLVFGTFLSLGSHQVERVFGFMESEGGRQLLASVNGSPVQVKLRFDVKAKSGRPRGDGSEGQSRLSVRVEGVEVVDAEAK